ncbi:BCS1 N terminal-domain-containing protein [Jimgerdemannia flammicorona]|uniref:BCS1 N terminal-domain-containing protein n=1 Tax=Jimgerdemannia flammicorona TaxID=994334 RepID=A0A433DK09_9FUNG|nr:BCS1 N terminal-domain-containing protein [Jimgerdemannia flammicorona]
MDPLPSPLPPSTHPDPSHPSNPTFIASVTANPFFSAGAGLIGVGAGLALLRQALNIGTTALRRRVLVSLEIPSKDKSYLWFLQWMSQQPARKTHQLAVETTFKQHDNGSVSTTFSLVARCVDTGTPFSLLAIWHVTPPAHLGLTTTQQVQRQRDGKMMDLTTGSPWETITLTTLSRDRGVFSQLLKEARELALAKQEGKTVMYTSWGPEWRPFGLPRRRRMLSSVILDNGIKERIVKDVKDFINNGSWYNERADCLLYPKLFVTFAGIPYRRGYLLYGPPGSGKSSFIQALAGELEYNICILNLSERGLTDDRLNHLLSNIPERSVMLLEDIDAAFTKRKQADQTGSQSMITFSGLLNALDGVASAEERIVFMTTNHIELLDPALVRPGRVDLKEYLGNATESQIRRMFLRFYEGQEDLAERFVNALRGREVSTAGLQGHFVYYKDNPEEAVSKVESVDESCQLLQ